MFVKALSLPFIWLQTKGSHKITEIAHAWLQIINDHKESSVLEWLGKDVEWSQNKASYFIGICFPYTHF